MTPSLQDASDVRLGLPSASKLERVCLCPGSENFIRTLPMDRLLADGEKPDELAERGTKIHRARETGVILDLSDEEHEIYEAGLAYEAKQVNKWKETYGLTEVVEGKRELRLWLHDPTTMKPIGSGQLDVHYHTPDWRYALVVDWKTGFLTHLTGATGNWQLRLQAILLWIEHPEIEMIRVSFAKALFKKAKLDYCDYSAQDCKYALDSVLFHLWEARQEDAVRHAGRWCRYCPARGFCPQAAALCLLPKTIAKSTLIGMDSAEAVASNDVTLASVKFLWQEASVIREILTAVTDRLKGMADEDLAKIGLTHGEPRILTPITDTGGAFKFLTTVQGWPEPDVWAAMKFGNGEVEALAQREEALSNRKAAGAWRKEAMAEFITVKECEKPIVEL